MPFCLHESIHILLFILIGALFYRKYRQKSVFFASLLGSVMLDLDHLVDYISYNGLNPNFYKMVYGNYFEKSGRLFIPLHAWEYVIILFAIGYFAKKLRPFMYTLAMSIFMHLLWDQITYSPQLLTYSITYRILTGYNLLSSFN